MRMQFRKRQRSLLFRSIFNKFVFNQARFEAKIDRVCKYTAMKDRQVLSELLYPGPVSSNIYLELELGCQIKKIVEIKGATGSRSRLIPVIFGFTFDTQDLTPNI
jgi:hypothetical protein